MRSYQHHIGDFNNATRHLDRIERSIYRDLIELYYDTEGPLPLDIPTICRRILARSNEESTVVERSLNEFFTQTPAGWYHDRCEAEIEKYRSSNSQRALAGKASAAKKAAKRQQALNGESTSVEFPLNGESTVPQNHKPVTSNQKPETKEREGATAPQAPKVDAKGARLPVDWQLPEPWREWAESEFPHINAKTEALTFRDYWVAKPGADGRKADWLATWRNWIRRAGSVRPAGKPRHTDFQNRDYSAGVSPDGKF